MSQPPEQIDPNSVTLFAQTTFRNQQRRFGIKLDDRRKHTYIIGKTGMGKTALLENMILSDIYAGHGCAYIDPHGDTAEKLLDFIPSWRINDVVYFNPADLEHPVGFNILETESDEQKHLVGSGLMGVFKKIWPDVWSPRMEYILLNCVLALLDYPGATLLGISRILVDKEYRQRVIEKIKDPIVKTFWVAEFSSWSEKYATEAIAPIQNKVGQFLSASVIRNIVAQVKSTIDARGIMDNRKIFIVNLSKGRIGEDNMRLLGGMIITKLQLAAMERVDIPEHERKDFFMYIDEFQNFATPSFADILSEARKYRLSLIVAHQFIEQLDETVRYAIFGNIGTIIIFRVGAPDALFMEKEFFPTFEPEDLVAIQKWHIYLKLMVDGVATDPFSAATLPPIADRTGSAEKIIQITRERYSTPRSEIEQKVLRWSGMESGPPPAEPTAEVLIPGGEVSYPAIKTEEEREEEAEAAEEGGQSGEILRFSAERLAAITKSQPKKKDKPKFKHTCSRCGTVWEMPVQLDPSRPMYCAECLPIVRDERKIKGKVMKAAVTGKPPEGIELEEVDYTERKETPKDSLAKAMRAVEDGKSIQLGKQKKEAPPEPNRPRLVVTDQEKLTDVIGEEETDEDASELIDAIAESRGGPVETRKKASVPSKESRQPERKENKERKEDRDDLEKKKRKRKRKQRTRSEVRDEPKHSSLEEHFEKAEKRFDQKEDKDDGESSKTVFKHPSSSQSLPSPTQTSGSQGAAKMRSMEPGQKIQFD
jgi:protein-arginine kinase activator protein McsA